MDVRGAACGLQAGKERSRDDRLVGSRTLASIVGKGAAGHTSSRNGAGESARRKRLSSHGDSASNESNGELHFEIDENADACTERKQIEKNKDDLYVFAKE